MMRLCVALLDRGGNPTILNERLETCLHCVCSQPDVADTRAAILEILLKWKNCSDDQPSLQSEEKLSLNRVDCDGNTAIHLAALNNLQVCVETLVSLGAIISIVNRGNLTCCELADQKQHFNLAIALELALVFQPVDFGMEDFNLQQEFLYDNSPGKLFLSGVSHSASSIDVFIEEILLETCSMLLKHDHRNGSDVLETNQCKGCELASDNTCFYRNRAEALLMSFAWDAKALAAAYQLDSGNVLQSARLQKHMFAGLLIIYVLILLLFFSFTINV
jgi:hypothetical protein